MNSKLPIILEKQGHFCKGGVRNAKNKYSSLFVIKKAQKTYKIQELNLSAILLIK